jgi:hypothetical protein
MTDRKVVKLQLAVTSRSALPLRSAGGTQECRKQQLCHRQSDIDLKI